MHDPEKPGREKKKGAVYIKVALIAQYIVDHLSCRDQTFCSDRKLIDWRLSRHSRLSPFGRRIDFSILIRYLISIQTNITNVNGEKPDYSFQIYSRFSAGLFPIGNSLQKDRGVGEFPFYINRDSCLKQSRVTRNKDPLLFDGDEIVGSTLLGKEKSPVSTEQSTKSEVIIPPSLLYFVPHCVFIVFSATTSYVQ